jgi:hypothetical protein
MLAEHGIRSRGGNKRLNPYLTDEQRHVLESIPIAGIDMNEILAYLRVITRQMLRRGKDPRPSHCHALATRPRARHNRQRPTTSRARLPLTAGEDQYPADQGRARRSLFSRPAIARGRRSVSARFVPLS